MAESIAKSERGNPLIGIKPAISSTSTTKTNREPKSVSSYLGKGFDYLLIPITNDEYRDKCATYLINYNPAKEELTPPEITETDITIVHNHHTTPRIIGSISSWVDLTSEDDTLNLFSRQVLENELRYANYIGLKEISIAPPKNPMNLSKYSRSIMKALSITKNYHTTITIYLPISEDVIFDEIGNEDPLSTWDIWNSIRTYCDYNPRLKVSLELLNHEIPKNVIDRWFTEPISSLLISHSLFLTNGNGYPVLSKSNQSLLQLYDLKTPILLLHDLEISPKSIRQELFLRYLNFIILKNRQPFSKIEIFAQKHNDVLLPPLQPLSINLDNFTYDVFAKDVIKYEAYGEAMTSYMKDQNDHEINIAIVGAGKGGLVHQLYKSIDDLKIMDRINRITIIEKNQNCLIELKSHFNHYQQVEILNVDMREWNPSLRYHMIVSELLGSFGCNELSPECLEPLMKYLTEDGISIPQSYQSWIAPITAPRLFQSLKNLKDPKAFHKPYVVRLLESQIVSTRVNKLWEFTHIPSQSLLHSSKLQKFETSVFEIENKCVLHGIAGYFTAKLFENVTISIVPETHTTDLISWFPMFFPIENPLYVKDNTLLKISMSRNRDENRVWYDWSLESFEKHFKLRTGICKTHNSDGQGFNIGL
ncbi:hypothetical protein WICMUC_005238 [Wickerhamomyces mucosus]|uniref:Protein arginine N-methyltransferase n=1 Tax=Wickerhamomyces mucosus TaxID=1378264 RepID=A0A9P8P8R4_9ASCO|nr:hypothetical protein WICMUC_005238 [Wickerhamomyces mucosus]